MQEDAAIGTKGFVEVEQSEVVHYGWDSCGRRTFKTLEPCVVVGHDEMLIEVEVTGENRNVRGEKLSVIPSDIMSQEQYDEMWTILEAQQ